jgi:hypothetical protein
MFIGDPFSVAFPNSIDFAHDSKRFAGQFVATTFRRFIVHRDDFFMKTPTGVNSSVSDTNFFDLFKVEQPLAVEESV